MGGGGGGLSESVKKEDIFSDIVEWSSKNFRKMITDDVKANKNKK